jgi:hypothetical protein
MYTDVHVHLCTHMRARTIYDDSDHIQTICTRFCLFVEFHTFLTCKIYTIRKRQSCVFCWVEISHEWFSWPGIPRDRRSSGFPRPRKTLVWYFHSKPTRLYHMPLIRVFWPVVRCSNNTHDVTVIPRRQPQCSRVIQPHSGLARSIFVKVMTSFADSVADWYNRRVIRKNITRSDAWQRQKFGRNVRIKLFSRVWNRFLWCSTDISPNYLGIWYDCLPLLCRRCDFETVFHKTSIDLGMW